VREATAVDVSVWAQDLLEYLVDHMDNERETLRRYGALAADEPDERIRYLLRLILEDEIRHHQLFAEIINALRSELEQREQEPRVPSGRGMTGNGQHAALLRETDALLALEKDDVRLLRKLEKELRSVADTSWWSVLLEVMALDTKKHVRILETVRDLA
jgi:rubrerythrin